MDKYSGFVLNNSSNSDLHNVRTTLENAVETATILLLIILATILFIYW